MSEQTAKQRQIESALISYYLPPEPGTGVISQSQLTGFLKKLPALTFGQQVGSLMNQVHQHHPGRDLSQKDHAILSFVDDAINKLLSATDLDFKVENLIRCQAGFLAIAALEQGPAAFSKEGKNFELLDILLKRYVGWSEDLGVLGDEFMIPVEERILSLVKGKSTSDDCLKNLRAELSKNDRNFTKLEASLVKSELAGLLQQKAKINAAKLLDAEMAGQKLPMFVIFLLQGAWYEFLQGVTLRYGNDSGEWKIASNLTEALIWSLQPRKNKAKQHKVMGSLPDKILSFNRKLNPDSTEMENVLLDIREEWEAIRQGNPSESCDFNSLSPAAGVVAEAAGKPVGAEISGLDVGKWYLYDDKDEPEDKIARVKLILNSGQTESLLFTNHNRHKALHLGYRQMKTFLANGTIKPLSIASSAAAMIKKHFNQILQNISGQIKKEKSTTKKTERANLVQLHRKARKSAQDQELEKQKRIAKIKQKRSIALRRKSIQKMETALESVEKLQPEAWVKLPLMAGTLTPCKLVAKIPGADKYIFANSKGIKVAEYSARQLSTLLVSENSEILDTGDEFAATLSGIIVGQRENRGKSYSELSGEVA